MLFVVTEAADVEATHPTKELPNSLWAGTPTDIQIQHLLNRRKEGNI